MGKSKVGTRQAVFRATLALSPYILVMLVGGSFEETIEVLSGIFKEAWFEILSGSVALYSTAIIFGGYAGRRIERNHQNNKLLCYVIGIGLAIGCLLATILAGALAALLHEVVTSGAETAIGRAALYLVSAPAYILLYAVLPAAILGVLYTILVVRVVRRSRSPNI